MRLFGGNGSRAEEETIAPEPPAPVERSEHGSKRHPAYGIAEAIDLMRRLPVVDDRELVVSVLRQTLASNQVAVAEIIEDAVRRENALDTRISDLRLRIAEHQRSISNDLLEIARLEEHLAETRRVKGDLELSEVLAVLSEEQERHAPTATASAEVTGDDDASVG